MRTRKKFEENLMPLGKTRTYRSNSGSYKLPFPDDAQITGYAEVTGLHPDCRLLVQNPFHDMFLHPEASPVGRCVRAIFARVYQVASADCSRHASFKNLMCV